MVSIAPLFHPLADFTRAGCAVPQRNCTLTAPTRVDPFTAGDLAPAPRTLIDILTDTAARHPDAPAIDGGQVALSYAELVDRIAADAREQAARGVGPGDRVGIRGPAPHSLLERQHGSARMLCPVGGCETGK
jgi:non-ribosomal peptide synthetase component F